MTSSTNKNIIRKKPQKDLFLKETLKKEDQVKIPQDQAIHDEIHNHIMNAVEKLQIKKLNKWAQPFVFLEPNDISLMGEDVVKLEAPNNVHNSKFNN